MRLSESKLSSKINDAVISHKLSNNDYGTKIKKATKKVGAIVVSISLGVACFATVTGEKLRESTEYGRMIAISSIETSDVQAADLGRISYEDMQKKNYESDQLAQIEESEKKYEDVLLEKKQEEKDKAALAALQKAEELAAAPSYEAAAEPVSSPADNYEVSYVYADGASSGEYLGQYVCTAYCACSRCCGKTDGITASGTYATQGRTIAADTSRFPFGTQLVIDGVVYTVEDRGSAIGGNRIDIFFDSHEAALQYGRRTTDVYAY